MSADGTGGASAVPSESLRAHPRLLVLIAAEGVSAFGAAVAMIAFSFVSYQVTGSLVAAVITMAAQALPAPLLMRPAKALALRFDLRWVLVTSHLAKAVLFLAVALFVSRGAISFTLLLVVALISGTIGALSFPSSSELRHQVAPPGKLVRLNSTTSSLCALASIAGVLVGGALFDSLGASSLFVVDGLTQLFPLVAVLLFGPLRVPASNAQGAGITGAFQLVRQTATLRRFVIIAVILQLIAWPILKLLPRVSSEISASATTFSLLLACVYAGMALVAPVLAWRERRFSHWTIALVALCILTLALSLFSLAPVAQEEVRLIALMIVLVPLGLSLSMATTLASAAVQLASPGALEAEVLAVHSAIITVLAPVGAIVITSIAGAWSVWAAVAVEAIGIVALLAYVGRPTIRHEFDVLLHGKGQVLHGYAVHAVPAHALPGSVETIRAPAHSR